MTWAQILLIILIMGHPKEGEFLKSSLPDYSMLILINEQRREYGLNSIHENPKLDWSAMLKCTDMIKRGYFDHFAPVEMGKTSPWYFFEMAGYKYSYAGENLARNFPTDLNAMTAFMKSPTHKDNILSTNYKEVGIAHCSGKLNGIETNLVVQHFGKSL